MTAWELIIVDDNPPGSDARRDTEAVADRLTSDSRIRYLRHGENRGGGAARNTGIEAARSDVVAFLDDDDEWHPTKLDVQLAALDAAAPTVAAVYCRIVVIEAETGSERLWPTGTSIPTTRQLLIRNTIGSTSCIMCRRAALVEIGLFDETLPSRQDIDLYVRLSQRFTFVFVDAPLMTLHRHGEVSITSNYDGAVRAHERFFEKYRSLIEADAEVLHARLHDLGYVLFDAGRYEEARRVLVRAWRTRPTSRATIVRLALTFALPRVAGRRAKQILQGLRRRRGAAPRVVKGHGRS